MFGEEVTLLSRLQCRGRSISRARQKFSSAVVHTLSFDRSLSVADNCASRKTYAPATS